MNKILASFVLATLTTSAFAQSTTNSPYSQFGLGDLTDQSVSFNKGMNGVGLGMHRGNEVNPMNPASYSSVDSLTFLFDAGMSGQITNYSENGKKFSAKSGGFDYVSALFRVFKNVGVSFGVLPYSNIGYDYLQTGVLDDRDETEVASQYSGEGGLHQMYIGAGIRPIKPLSVGFNLSYLWGDYSRSMATVESSNLSVLAKEYRADISSYKLDFGVQFDLPLNKKDYLTLAAVWSPGHSLKSDPECLIANVKTSISKADTTTYVISDGLKIPTTFGFGVAYHHAQNLRVGADLHIQKWGSVDFPSYTAGVYALKSGLLKDSYRLNLGGEWTPNPMARSVFKRIQYRAGVGMVTPYYYINGKEGPKEFSASLGFGIPIANGYNNRSVLHISGQFVRRSADNLIKENMFRLNIGFTFNEKWFAKWKVE
jgi:hypothetical protein